MKSTNKWISTAAIALAMLIVLYYHGVIDSKLVIGVGATAMSGILLISTFMLPPSEDE
jgi:hypothetical protein